MKSFRRIARAIFSLSCCFLPNTTLLRHEETMWEALLLQSLPFASTHFSDLGVPSPLRSSTSRSLRCALSRLRCNGHCLLFSSYLPRIYMIENSSCSIWGHPTQDTSHLILHCPVTDSSPLALWRLCFFTTSGPDSKELTGFWGSMVFHHAPIFERGRVTIPTDPLRRTLCNGSIYL